jgi:hypothetical protein
MGPAVAPINFTHMPCFCDFMSEKRQIRCPVISCDQSHPCFGNLLIGIEPCDPGRNTLLHVSVQQMRIHEQMLLNLSNIGFLITRIPGNLGYIATIAPDRIIYTFGSFK